MVDILAAELKMDPAELRLKNFVGNGRVPVPDRHRPDLRFSGNYAAPLSKALDMVDYTKLRAGAGRGARAGQLMGIGISTYGEICAFGPSPATPAGGWESATVKIEPTGKVTVMTGASPHGQGEETTFAQIAADELGVRHRRHPGAPRRYRHRAVRHRHLRQPRHGRRRHGALLRAAGSEGEDQEVRRDAARIRRRHASPAARASTTRPASRVSFAEIAGAAYRAMKLPPNTEPGLVATHFWEPPNFTFPFGAHIVVTEVDRETGADRHPPLRRGGRLRQHHQPAARRRPGARRRRAGPRARRCGSRPSTTTTASSSPASSWTTRCRKRAHDAVDREQPHRYALAGESAGREGRGRSRHHRLLARRGEFGGGCAVATSACGTSICR